MKIILCLCIVIFFTGCSINKNLNTNNTFSSENKIINYSLNGCSSNSYTSKVNDIKYGKLFIEEVSLNSYCFWNGLSRSYFEQLFKSSLNINSLKVVQRFDYSNYEFTTYLVNGKYYINLIYAYSFNSDKFILDYKGLYFENKVKNFDSSYINTSMYKDRFPLDYDESLVKKNIINNYFQKERPQYNR